VGKVCMDRNSPNFYCATAGDNLADTLTFINTLRWLFRFNPEQSVPGFSLELIKLIRSTGRFTLILFHLGKGILLPPHMPGLL